MATAGRRPAQLARLRRGLQGLHVLAPVSGQGLQPLPPRHHVAVGPPEARLVEVGRVAGGAQQPAMREPHLGQEIVEGLVLVQAAAHLVHGVGVSRHAPHRPALGHGLDAPRGGVMEVDEVLQDVARLPPVHPRGGRPPRTLEVRQNVLHRLVEALDQRFPVGSRRHLCAPWERRSAGRGTGMGAPRSQSSRSRRRRSCSSFSNASRAEGASATQPGSSGYSARRSHSPPRSIDSITST